MASGDGDGDGDDVTTHLALRKVDGREKEGTCAACIFNVHIVNYKRMRQEYANMHVSVSVLHQQNGRVCDRLQANCFRLQERDVLEKHRANGDDGHVVVEELELHVGAQVVGGAHLGWSWCWGWWWC